MSADIPLRSPILATRDGSGLKEARELQRSMAARLQFTLAATQMGEWDMDLGTRLVRRSLRFDQCFGHAVASGDWPIERFFQHIHEDDRDWVRIHMLSAIEQHTSLRYECRVVWPDGSEHWIGVHGAIHERADKGPHMIGVVADISERITAERALQAAKAEKLTLLEMLAQQLQRHRAPMHAAAGALEAPPNADAVTQRDGAQQLARHAEQLAGAVDEYLDLARMTMGQASMEHMPLTMQDVIAGAVAQTRPLIDTRRQHLHLALEPEPVPVWGDGKRLGKALGKLLDNASRYTPEGGNITLRLQAHDQQLVVAVSDDGIGMPAETLAHALDLFARTSSDSGRNINMGMGLTLARCVVEQHGGTLTATSGGPGAGSEFVVTLPQLGQYAAQLGAVAEADLR